MIGDDYFSRKADEYYSQVELLTFLLEKIKLSKAKTARDVIEIISLEKTYRSQAYSESVSRGFIR